MRSEPNILAFDTSAAHCAAALLCRDAICRDVTIEMARGQAEALMPLLEQTLAAQGVGWPELDALAVGVGPGNFTGIRISVSAARGLALALGIPAVGVSTFDVMAFQNMQDALLVSLPAPRNKAYVQPFRRGRAIGNAQLIDPAAPPADLQMSSGMVVTGYLAGEIGQHFDCVVTQATLENVPGRIARIAERRLAVGPGTTDRPAPLYVRAADAAPPSDIPPAILP